VSPGPRLVHPSCALPLRGVLVGLGAEDVRYLADEGQHVKAALGNVSHFIEEHHGGEEHAQAEDLRRTPPTAQGH